MPVWFLSSSASTAQWYCSSLPVKQRLRGDMTAESFFLFDLFSSLSFFSFYLGVPEALPLSAADPL